VSAKRNKAFKQTKQKIIHRDPGLSSEVTKQDLEERSKPNLDHHKP